MKAKEVLKMHSGKVGPLIDFDLDGDVMEIYAVSGGELRWQWKREKPAMIPILVEDNLNNGLDIKV